MKCNMKTVLFTTRKKKDRKVKCLTVFWWNSNEDHPLRFEEVRFFLNYFPLIWAHSLGAETGRLASKSLWVCHWLLIRSKEGACFSLYSFWLLRWLLGWFSWGVSAVAILNFVIEFRLALIYVSHFPHVF